MVKSNIVPMRISSATAKKRIAECAKDSARIILTCHGEMRSGTRTITRRQVIRCLMHGFFTEHPCWDQIHGNFKFTMQTVDSGVRINVAAALDKNDDGDYIIVVTVF